MDSLMRIVLLEIKHLLVVCHCEERSDEAIYAIDYFAALAMAVSFLSPLRFLPSLKIR